MNELLFFYMKRCPHCKKAEKFLEELMQEEKYANIPIRRIEETEEKELAESYDYWYVPSFFLNGKKLHEGSPTMEDIKRVLETALES
ncbi:MAG: thioredoxin family protein [Clostridia bacterium]|nr:thioredoxin family protein [Clostridia bacterium]